MFYLEGCTVWEAVEKSSMVRIACSQKASVGMDLKAADGRVKNNVHDGLSPEALLIF